MAIFSPSLSLFFFFCFVVFLVKFFLTSIKTKNKQKNFFFLLRCSAEIFFFLLVSSWSNIRVSIIFLLLRTVVYQITHIQHFLHNYLVLQLLYISTLDQLSYLPVFLFPFVFFYIINRKESTSYLIRIIRIVNTDNKI